MQYNNDDYHRGLCLNLASGPSQTSFVYIFWTSCTMYAYIYYLPAIRSMTNATGGWYLLMQQQRLTMRAAAVAAAAADASIESRNNYNNSFQRQDPVAKSCSQV
jgi:hypothetical protein